MTCDDPDCTACAAIRHFIKARDAGVTMEQVIEDTLTVIGVVYDVEIVTGQIAEVNADATIH